MEEMMNQYLLDVVLTTAQKSAWPTYYLVYAEMIILGFSSESFRCLLDTDMMEYHCKNKM